MARTYYWYIRVIHQVLGLLVYVLFLLVILGYVLISVKIWIFGRMIDSVVAMYSDLNSVVSWLGFNLPLPLLWFLVYAVIYFLEITLAKYRDWILFRLDTALSSGYPTERFINKFYELNIADIEQMNLYDKIALYKKHWNTKAFWLLKHSVNLLGNLVGLLSALVILLKRGNSYVYIAVSLVFVGIFVSGIVDSLSRRVTYKSDVSAASLVRNVNYILERLLDMRFFTELKVNRIYRKLSRRYATLVRKLTDSNIEGGRKAYRLALVADFVRTLFFTIAQAFYLYKGLLEKTEVGHLTAGFNLLAQVFTRLKGLIQTYVAWRADLRYVQDFMNLFKLESINFTSDGKVQIAPRQPLLLELRNLTYVLPGTKTLVAQNIDLVIEPYSKVFIYGKDGVGKTFLTKVLTTLFPVPPQKYFINGVDVRNIKRGVVKDLFSIVPDSFGRYEFSLKEAVTLGGSNKFDKKRYIEALEIADLYEWAKDLGLLFSDRRLGVLLGSLPIAGGFWQRIAIARAIYRDAPILLLDMPFTFIDDKGRQWIMERLLDFVTNKRKTLIHIDEDLSLQRYFDVSYEKGTYNLTRLY